MYAVISDIRCHAVVRLLSMENDGVYFGKSGWGCIRSCNVHNLLQKTQQGYESLIGLVTVSVPLRVLLSEAFLFQEPGNAFCWLWEFWRFHFPLQSSRGFREIWAILSHGKHFSLTDFLSANTVFIMILRVCQAAHVRVIVSRFITLAIPCDKAGSPPRMSFSCPWADRERSGWRRLSPRGSKNYGLLNILEFNEHSEADECRLKEAER